MTLRSLFGAPDNTLYRQVKRLGLVKLPHNNHTKCFDFISKLIDYLLIILIFLTILYHFLV
ncbi:hypothetical protein SynBOUM118_01032 [Synechococcus sp. BOUM118]|nr:hypothetical protein SynBOUM118_01032 [Synechococcus sp. BOUM118]